ncbi:MAG: hypothetical protein V2A71_03905 [Candidatus Eisenbacteria bacterium]
MRKPTFPSLTSIILILMLLPCGGMAENGRDGAREIVLAPGVSASQLGVVKQVMISFSGINPLQTRIFEDFLAHELMNLGIEVVERGKVENVIAEQVAAHEEESRAGTPKSHFINAVQVGRLIGADTIIIGTLIDTILQFGSAGDSKNYASGQKLQCLMTSAQFVSVASEKILVSFSFDYEEGRSLKDAARDIATGFGDRTGR